LQANLIHYRNEYSILVRCNGLSCHDITGNFLFAEEVNSSQNDKLGGLSVLCRLWHTARVGVADYYFQYGSLSGAGISFAR
jgi:hypothetical protein